MKLQNSLPEKVRPDAKETHTYPPPSYLPPNPAPSTARQYWNEYKYPVIMLTIAIIITLGALLCYGQETPPRGIQKGQQVPDIRINSILNYPAKTARISGFRGKLLILDFWATWCSPCIAMIPKMDSLQKEFPGQVQFLPVSNQSRQTVTAFLGKLYKLKPFDLPDVPEDTALNQLFPHTYLPHFVWIGKDGKVAAITGYEQVNAQNIRALLAGQSPNLPLKADHLLSGDDSHLPGSQRDTTGNPAIYHKLSPGYQEDLPSKWENWPGDQHGKRIFCTNLVMPDLFDIALGEGETAYPRNRRIYAVKDTAAFALDISGEDAIEWLKQDKHATSYEVKVPPGMEKLAFRIMQQDLQQYFTQYDVSIEKRPVKCLALVRTTTTDLLRSKGGKSVSEFDGISAKLVNFPLVRLVAELSAIYQYKSPYPIIDQTGYQPWVDLEINANLHDMKAINQQLAKYGLEFKLSEQTLDMLVIRDHKTTHNP